MNSLRNVLLGVYIIVSSVACTSVAKEMRESGSAFGHQAEIHTRQDVDIMGELLLQRPEQLWIVSLEHHVIVIPFKDIRTVEIEGTQIRAYLGPSIALLGVPGLVGGAVAAGNGDPVGLLTGIAVGGALTLIPVAFNEAGLSNPVITINQITEGHLSPYLRYPFRTVSDTLTSQVLASYGQATPDTLRLPDVRAGE